MTANQIVDNDLILLAYVIGAYGIKGWVRLKTYSQEAETLLRNAQWLVMPSKASPQSLQTYTVAETKWHQQDLLVFFENIQSRTDAENLKGAQIFLRRSDFPKPNQDEYYWIDLIGLAVVNREGQALGSVADLLDTGAHSVLRVIQPEESGADGKTVEHERLIPFVAAYIDEVSLPERRITVDWGLDF